MQTQNSAQPPKDITLWQDLSAKWLDDQIASMTDWSRELCAQEAADTVLIEKVDQQAAWLRSHREALYGKATDRAGEAHTSQSLHHGIG